MGEYKVYAIDCAGMKGKNFQRINTIEIFYYVNMDNKFGIEYNFYNIDFEIWKGVLKIHLEDCEYELWDRGNKIIRLEDLTNTEAYYTFYITSADFNLYRNINIIPFLKKGGWDNMNEMIEANVWR